MVELRTELSRAPISVLNPRARRAWQLLAGFLAAGVGVLFVLSLTAADVITVRGAQVSLYGWILVATMFGVVVLCGWRAVIVRDERAPWILMTIAIASWGVGNFIWQLVYGGLGPFPLWTEAVWLSFYLPAYGAVAYLVRSRGLLFNNFGEWIDGMIVILATAAVATFVLYGSLAHEFGDSVLSTAVVLAYPVGDLAVLGAVVMVLMFTGWRPGRAWHLILLGLFLDTVADVMFTYQTVHESYVYGGWTDFIWVISFVMLGFAAWQPHEATSTNTAHIRPGLTGLAMTGAAAALALAVLLLSATNLTGGSGGGVSAYFAGVAMVLVLVRALVAFRDISRAGELLAVSNSKLLEVGRLKDQVMSTVSHELRNPLTAVAGYTELLLDDVGGGLNPDDRSLLGRIDSESTHLLRILDDLQLVNALEEGDGALVVSQRGFGPVDLALVARDAVAGVSVVAARQGVDVHLSLDGDGIWIDGDEQRLRQVVDNLLSNAVKFSPSGGGVDLWVLRDAEEIVVTVRDHGIGIEREDQGLLFTRFFRAANARANGIPGTGLGLSIVKAIVAQHEGTITITSDVGVGTVVTVRLPVDHLRTPHPTFLNEKIIGV